MRPNLAAGGLLAALWLAAPSAMAQTIKQQLAVCVNEDDAYPADLALSACNAVVKATPAKTDGLWLIFHERANAQFGLKAYDKALEDYDKAISLNPEDMEAFLGRGNVFVEQGDHAHAIESYSEAMRLEPESSVAVLARASAFFDAGDYTRAIVDFDRVVSLQPTSAAAVFLRSAAYEKLGDYVRSAVDLDRAAELEPENAGFHKDRCRGRSRLDQELDVARAACDVALRLNPGDADILDYRGFVSMKRKHWKAAWSDFDEAVRIDPETSSHYLGRGIAAEQLGRAAESQADIQRAKLLEAGQNGK